LADSRRSDLTEADPGSNDCFRPKAVIRESTKRRDCGVRFRLETKVAFAE
jgi:hypothetical protein